ncbi:MAG: hypothetical protein HYW24_03945 [Candidatus Aenigmarchaeota archaeon]|nr:hypothetical protein [Candidatus Aenigmarchaeota archaeon]
MSEFEDFLRKQDEIYSKFRSSPVKSEGVESSQAISKCQGGYIVALRHPASITDAVADFSRKIAAAVPALVYDENSIHTSIAVYGLQDDFIHDTSVLKSLSACLQPICSHDVRGRVTSSPIRYQEWLFNQDSVIVGGAPSDRFFYMGKIIVDSLKENGIEVRPPWGAHITASRYTQSRKPEELVEFFELMEHAPVLGLSRPLYLDVGYFRSSPERFYLETYERFSLKTSF